MTLLFTCSPVGVICYDEHERQELARIPHPSGRPHRVYGLDVDPKEGQLLVGYTDDWYLVNLINKDYLDWLQYTSFDLREAHSLQLTADRRVLVSSALNDRLIEFDGVGKVVNRVKLSQYFKPPKWYDDSQEAWPAERRQTASQWTHINYGYKMGDGTYLCTVFYYLGDDYQKLNTGFVCALKDGQIRWAWGGGILKWPHCILPIGGHRFLIADSGNGRLVEIHVSQGIVDEFLFHDFPYTKPRIHWIEPYLDGRYLLPNCDRDNPQILAYDIESREMQVVWFPSDELRNSGQKSNTHDIIQPYVVRTLDKKMTDLILMKEENRTAED